MTAPDPHLNCTYCPACGGKMGVEQTRAHGDYGFATCLRVRACKACKTRVQTIEILKDVADDVFAENAA